MLEVDVKCIVSSVETRAMLRSKSFSSSIFVTSS